MSLPTNSILLLGKGELGTALLTSLTLHPFYSPTTTKITLLTRSPPSYSLPANISTHQADITTATLSSLISIFNSHTTIIQASGFAFPPGTHLNIAKAAISAPNVKYFIPWQFGVDYDIIGKGSAHKVLFDEFLEVRELLRSQEIIKWNIFSSGLFMSFLFGVKEFGVVDFEQRVVRGLGGWGNKVTVTDVEGIGRMVAEVVLSEKVESRVVYIGGETVTYDEVADVLAEMGMDMRREEILLDEIRERLRENPGDKMVRYQTVFAEGVGVWWEKEKMLNWRLGIKLRGVREWLSENLDGLLQDSSGGY
ncbi:isoflavone reductase-like protein [Podospora fimiseda]|uniref:Isoflavone reductase-like protein n=1 Tax=Podospora fimiseda TaxID=252190 RepID=A0AAN6YSA2_9PEZI|nr:isoflavone reductase-like protein [Podospora fimiseda]